MNRFRWVGTGINFLWKKVFDESEFQWNWYSTQWTCQLAFDQKTVDELTWNHLFRSDSGLIKRKSIPNFLQQCCSISGNQENSPDAEIKKMKEWIWDQLRLLQFVLNIFKCERASSIVILWLAMTFCNFAFVHSPSSKTLDLWDSNTEFGTLWAQNRDTH